jgi:hypothetical protein
MAGRTDVGTLAANKPERHMSDEKKPKLARINFAQELHITIDQIESGKINTRIHDGHAEATAYAEELADKTGRPCAIMGPQSRVATRLVRGGTGELALEFDRPVPPLETAALSGPNDE